MNFSNKKTKWKVSVITVSNGKKKLVLRPFDAAGQITLDPQMAENLFSQSKQIS